MNSKDTIRFRSGTALVLAVVLTTLLAIVGATARQQLPPRFQSVAVVVGNVIVMALGLRILARLFL